MYDLWVTKRLCSKACESEFDTLWQNICESDDMENLPSMTSLVTTKWAAKYQRQREQHNV